MLLSLLIIDLFVYILKQINQNHVFIMYLICILNLGNKESYTEKMYFQGRRK